MAVPSIGDIICKAGRGTRCVHKRNVRLLGGDVKAMTCAINADRRVCSKAGKAVVAEVI